MINFIDAATQICGGGVGTVTDIVRLVGKIISIFQIAIPIILVVMGLVSLGKAVVSSKDDEVKKATSGLIKKIILAAAVFFVVAIVRLVVGLVSSTTDTNMKDCWEIIANPWS